MLYAANHSFNRASESLNWIGLLRVLTRLGGLFVNNWSDGGTKRNRHKCAYRKDCAKQDAKRVKESTDTNAKHHRQNCADACKGLTNFFWLFPDRVLTGPDCE